MTSTVSELTMAQPTLEINIAIIPARFALGDETCTLTITATLDHPHPITIYTWFSISNLYYAQRRQGDFFCTDLSDNDNPVNMSIDLIQRTPCVSLQLGGQDDRFLITFYPGNPVTFTNKFDKATSKSNGALKPGHCYRFGIQPGERTTKGMRYFRWLNGIRDEVLTKEFKWAREELQSSTFLIKGGEDVEFEVDGDAAPAKVSPGAGRWCCP